MTAESRIYGRAFVDGTLQDDILLTMRDGALTDVVQRARVPSDAQRIDGVIVPGFVDLHIHGGDGADFMDADESANAKLLAFHAKHGTTTVAATTLSASRADLHAAVQAIGRVAARETHGAEIVAVHLEGPYINDDRAGAQNRSSIRKPDIDELASLLAHAPDLRWIVTLAPELNGARALIEHFRGRVLFSIGHTAADYSEAVAALEWGAKHFTHLFNAMTGMHHREPGTVGAALVSTEATAELIADGTHVHPAVLRIAVMAMPRRVALVTDAIRACGMPDGTYKLYEHELVVKEGMARLTDGTLGGSTLTMARAVQNMVELAGLPLETVIPLATEVPARIIGVAERKGRLEQGYDADVVVLSPRFEVTKAWVRGEEA